MQLIESTYVYLFLYTTYHVYKTWYQPIDHYIMKTFQTHADQNQYVYT